MPEDCFDERVASRYDAALVDMFAPATVFNTIVNLTTQDAQVACFANASHHLEPEGRFIVEALVPALCRLPPGDRARVVDVTAEHAGIDEYDTTSQKLVSHHHSVVDGVTDVHSVPFRHVWPSELDLMARLAGMTLRERWGGWRHERFTDESAMHVSVYEAPAIQPHG